MGNIIKLHILRHAESVGNATGRYSTAASDALSNHGRHQAQNFAHNFRAHAFEHIIVSPLQRTRETIRPYLEITGRQAEIWPEIAEACWHDEVEAPRPGWRSCPDQLPGEAVEFFTYRDGQAVRPAHPESYGEGLRRVHDAYDLIRCRADSYPGSILMVTHGHFARELIKHILDMRGAGEIHHDNCGMSLLSFDQTWSMEYCNRPGADRSTP